MNIGNQDVALIPGAANPYAGKRYRLTWGGEIFESTLGANGELLDADGNPGHDVNATVSSGELTLQDDARTHILLTIPVRRVPLEALPQNAAEVQSGRADTLAAIARRLRNLSYLTIDPTPTTASLSTSTAFWRALAAYMFKNHLSGWESALDPSHAVTDDDLFACLDHLVRAHDTLLNP